MPMPLGWMKEPLDPQWLREKYLVEKLSTTDIADLCGYSPRHIARLLDKFGIPKRSRKEGVKTQKSREKRSVKMKGKLTGNKNPMYKCGHWISNGYIFTKINGKDVPIHRLVASTVIGRPLKPTEIVHHIDGNKLNNQPQNLLIVTRSQHRTIHNFEMWAKRKQKESV
ncbi:HNH endonuclease signature motif containing protein [Thermoanaerobacterium thermosaccharolyticum]|uniref:HNH endonuclease signature motif containing protein n=1 Tax=Thermoanaerobacterium thermosaccharolyticum TaxID=1517 RepID=UPI003D269565